MTVYAIIPIAGSGTRFGGSVPKQFVELDGEKIIRRTLRTICQHPGITGGVVVCADDQIENVRQMLADLPGFKDAFEVTGGGETRQDSVANGLRQLPENADFILVHDGVRPMVTPALIADTISAAEKTGAAIAAVPAKDTIKRVRDDLVVETPQRDQLVMVQTPQVSRGEWLRRAHSKAKKEGFQTTDESALLEWAGYPVRIVNGDYRNIKITTNEDLQFASALLKRD